jgi:hypothetical protein
VSGGAPSNDGGPDPAAAPRLQLLPAGDAWIALHGDEVILLRDRHGVRYMALLVASPWTPMHVLDLMAANGGRGSGLIASSIPRGEGCGPMLDGRAKAEYARRLAALENELEAAESWNDLGRAERLRLEADFLERELSRAVGLGGRDRMAGAASERARVNVTLRIRKAIKSMEDHSPRLAHHLSTCIKTGMSCVYQAPPG